MILDRRYVSARAGSGVVLAAFILAVAVATPVRARPAAPAAGVSGEEEALTQLARSGAAPADTAYRGVRFLSAWTAGGASTMLVHVEHSPGGGTVVNTVGAHPGRDGTAFRLRAGSNSRGLARVTLELLAAQYRLALVDTAPVAGRSAYVIEVRRGDRSLAGRFWVDRETGLLLRREIRDRRGRVVRASAFIALTLGEPPITATAARPMPRPWRQRVPAAELETLRGRGWTLPRVLPGGLSLVDARRGVPAGRSVVHLTYSDGLSVVSVFVQRGTLAAREAGGWQETELAGCCLVYRQRSIPRRVMWAGDGYVYTVVADAPPDVVERLVRALPHAERDRGIWSRMTRGFTRLGAWLNPVG